MARVVKAGWRAAPALLLALWPAWAAAVGPLDPFTAPAPTLPADSTSAPPTSGLTGVRLGHQPAALIDGAWVSPGQAVRGARLASVRPDGALLRFADGRTERVALFPVSAAPAETADVSILAHRPANKRGPP